MPMIANVLRRIRESKEAEGLFTICDAGVQQPSYQVSLQGGPRWLDVLDEESKVETETGPTVRGSHGLVAPLLFASSL